MVRIYNGLGSMTKDAFIERVASWDVCQLPGIIYPTLALEEVCLARGWNSDWIINRIQSRIWELYPATLQIEWDGYEPIHRVAKRTGVHENAIFWSAHPAKRKKYFGRD